MKVFHLSCLYFGSYILTFKGDIMDNGMKCCLGIIVIFVIIALFLFWPSAPEAKKTYMEWDVDSETSDGNDGCLNVVCYENNTDYDENDTELENATVLVNVTYENGTVVKYNLTTDVFGRAEIQNLSAGQYKISACLVGDETHNSSACTEDFEVMEYVAPSETESDTSYDAESETSYGTTQGYTYTYRWVYV